MSAFASRDAVRCLLHATLLLAALVAALPADAARLFVLDPAARNDPSVPYFEPRCNLQLSGEIQAGNAARIAEALDAFHRGTATGTPVERFSNPLKGFLALCLSSEGGDIREAMAIADLFKDWMTVVPAGGRCISACAILFMRAGRRDGVMALEGMSPGRYLHYTGALAFHAPRLAVPASQASAIPPESVAEAYNLAVRTLGLVIFTGAAQEGGGNRADTVGLLPSTDFMPSDLLFAFLSTPPDQLYSISRINELLSWGIEPFGFPAPRQISERMALVACINVAHARCIAGRDRARCLGHRIEPPMRTDATEPVDDRFFAERSHYRVATSRVWPKPGGSSRYSELVATVTHAYPSGGEQDKPCVLKALFEGATLRALDIETFNGPRGATWIKGGELTRVTPNWDEAIRNRLRKGAAELGISLRPWKMLPANTRLEDLGREPWRPIEVGPGLRP